MFYFHNDYNEACHPAVLEKIQNNMGRQMSGYSEDTACANAAAMIRRICENESLAVHFLVGGTQTNLIVIAAALRPHQAALGADTAHINVQKSNINGIFLCVCHRHGAGGKPFHMGNIGRGPDRSVQRFQHIYFIIHNDGPHTVPSFSSESRLTYRMYYSTKNADVKKKNFPFACYVSVCGARNFSFADDAGDRGSARNRAGDRTRLAFSSLREEN